MQFSSRFAAIALVSAIAAIHPFAARSQQTGATTEYAKHLGALSRLSIEVAQAMPAEKYGYRPHPESMTFGELMVHIAATNYQFCAGLKDTAAPSSPNPTGKDAIVKLLDDSFQYCSAAIGGLSADQLNAAHDSPDGHMPGREVLLAMFVHVAHHRGQAEIYLRANGIKPPGYKV